MSYFDYTVPGTITSAANNEVKRLRALHEKKFRKQTGQFLAEVSTESTRNIVLTHLSEKNNSPHLAESTVLYYISEIFDGDIYISSQDGPEMTHYIGESDFKNTITTIC